MYHHLSDKEWEGVAGWEEDGMSFYLTYDKEKETSKKEFLQKCANSEGMPINFDKNLTNAYFKSKYYRKRKVKVWTNKHYKRDHPDALNNLETKPRAKTKHLESAKASKQKMTSKQEESVSKMSAAFDNLKVELSKLKEEKEQSEVKLREEIKKLTEENEKLKRENQIIAREKEYLKNTVDELKARDELSEVPSSKRPRQSEAYVGSMVDHNVVTDSEDSSDENSIDGGDDSVSTVKDTDQISSDVALKRTLDVHVDASVNQDDDLTSNAWIRSPSTALERIYTNFFVKSVVSAAVFLFLFHAIEVAVGIIC